jgi:hypothetical protein
VTLADVLGLVAAVLFILFPILVFIDILEIWRGRRFISQHIEERIRFRIDGYHIDIESPGGHAFASLQLTPGPQSRLPPSSCEFRLRCAAK